jgi:hypothetical protein
MKGNKANALEDQEPYRQLARKSRNAAKLGPSGDAGWL